mgnify:CR=1 FL=1
MILRDPLRYPEHQSILKDSRNRYRTMSPLKNFT